MADTPDLRVEQAQAAIRHLIEQSPGGRIPAEELPEYDRLRSAWLAAMEARGESAQDRRGQLAA